MHRDARMTITAPPERLYLTMLYGHVDRIKRTTPTSLDALQVSVKTYMQQLLL
jgi:hypothetical protein